MKDLKRYTCTAGKIKWSIGLQVTNAATEIAGQLRFVINKNLATGRTNNQRKLTTISTAMEGYVITIVKMEAQLVTIYTTLVTIVSKLAVSSVGGGGGEAQGAASAHATAAASITTTTINHSTVATAAT